MSIGLHPNCLSNLKAKLEAALDGVIITNNMFLDRGSLGSFLALESSLPSSKDFKLKLESYISESPIYDFLFGQLSRELYETQKFASNTPTIHLIDITTYSNKQDVSRRLIDSFESLPWDYVFTFALNAEISKHIMQPELQLTGDIKLIRPSEDFKNRFSLKSGIPGRDRWLHGSGFYGLLGTPAEWDANLAYIQISRKGYVGKFLTTTPEYSAIEEFKSILGLAIAIRAFEVRYSSSSTTSKERIYIHQNNDNSFQIVDNAELDEAVSKTISELRVDDLNGKLTTDEKKSFFVDNRLNFLAKALVRESGKERLLLSGKWIFDSYCGQNELLSFIQTMVALEILLGDKAVSDLIGLTELLRNRCAYLIGKSYQQREDILKDFKDIYEIRSKIVHRGKGRLTKDERNLFHKLQWMVNRVIQEEIELIAESN